MGLTRYLSKPVYVDRGDVNTELPGVFPQKLFADCCHGKKGSGSQKSPGY